jgi:hypothetical protein
MEICPKCSQELFEIEEKCPTCGFYVGHPNVRATEKLEEQKALEARYQTAIMESKADGREQAVLSFDESMQKTCAVINVDLKFLYQFITDDKMMYTNYELAKKGQARRPAQPKDDSDRRTIGAMLFGSYAEEYDMRPSRWMVQGLNPTGLMLSGSRR